MGVGTRIVPTGAAVPSLGHARASRPCQARHAINDKVNFAIALRSYVSFIRQQVSLITVAHELYPYLPV